MAEDRTAGYAERLKEALEVGPAPMSVRGFAEQLRERFPELRGTSYGGVRQYVDGKVLNPRVELLRAMADVLEVRPEWLALDDGEMTHELEEARRAKEKGLPLHPYAERFNEEITEALAVFGVPVSPLARAVFIHAWHSAVRTNPIGGIASRRWATPKRFAQMLAAPLAELPEGGTQSVELEGYIVEMAPVMARVLAGYVEQRPRIERAEKEQSNG